MARFMRVRVSIEAWETVDDANGDPVNKQVSDLYDETFSSGTGTRQVDLVWGDATRNVSSAAAIDLRGDLKDAAGTTVNAAEVAVLAVRNLSETVGETVTVGGGSNPFVGFGSTMKVYPKGLLLCVAPLDTAMAAVTAGTGDLLQLESATGTAETRLILGAHTS